MSQLHANCVRIGAHAVLLRGPSGSGKSGLSLRLIDAGGFLVSDDRTDLVARDGRLIASAPDQIAGLCEVRGIGVVRGLPQKAEGDVRVLIDLVTDPNTVERMPEPEFEEICGIAIPRWTLCASDLAIEAKIGVALALATGGMTLEP
ncbi:HPr kinase/phosphorylase [Thalassospira sp. UBA1131]|uniref:HPr kinase/phosphorylase n=1 Tax=Thalassospira sp. UBA1131 TaxID=1947672 RepID=UPI0025F9D8FF|nr:HPr kinase/phosphatase C-terminal domain-containing protein [Thalassospira sp. UBA1131]